MLSIEDSAKIRQFDILIQNVEQLRVLRRNLDRLEQDRTKYANRNDINLKPLEVGITKVKVKMLDTLSKVL